MADGPAVRLQDVIVPEIFTPYAQTRTEQKTRILNSGIMQRNSYLDTLLAGGGLTFKVPSFDDLDDDQERTATDTSSPFDHADANLPDGVARDPNPKKLGTKSEIAVRMNRNQSWSTTRLTGLLINEDPMAAIANRVAEYWARRYQRAFISLMNGVIASNEANNNGDYMNDISGSSYQAGVTDFSAEAFLDAATTMGDSQEDLIGVIVHSVVYNRMQKNNLIDFIPDSDGRVNIPTFLGREVIVDDGMPRRNNVYDTWLFGPGMVQMGVSAPPRPTAVETKEGAGNGAGQDVLYNRIQFTMHPTGHAYIGDPPDGGPANSGTGGDDLDEASSWIRRYHERKQIKFARLVTREA